MSMPIVECISGPRAARAQRDERRRRAARRARRTGSMRRDRSSRRPPSRGRPRPRRRGTAMPTTWIRWPRFVIVGLEDGRSDAEQARRRCRRGRSPRAARGARRRPGPRRTRGRRRAASTAPARGCPAPRSGTAARRRRARSTRRPRAGPAGRPACGRVAHGREEGGEEPRVEGAGRGDEVAHHEAHRRTDVVPAREAPAGVGEQRRPGEERLDDPRDDVLRREPLAHRAVVGGEAAGRRPAAQLRVDRLRRQPRARRARGGAPRR